MKKIMFAFVACLLVFPSLIYAKDTSETKMYAEDNYIPSPQNTPTIFLLCQQEGLSTRNGSITFKQDTSSYQYFYTARKWALTSQHGKWKCSTSVLTLSGIWQGLYTEHFEIGKNISRVDISILPDGDISYSLE